MVRRRSQGDGRSAVPARADRPALGAGASAIGARACERGSRLPRHLRQARSPLASSPARPEKLNALDEAMIAGLGRGRRRASMPIVSVRAAILTGEGKGFCAGGDIAAWGKLCAAGHGRRLGAQRPPCLRPAGAPALPLVAALTGHALGGGLELAATADIRIAEEQAKFGLPETGIGMVPGWSGTQRLVRRFGAQAVRRLALAGEIVAAERALAARPRRRDRRRTGEGLATGPSAVRRRSPRAGRSPTPSPSR